MRAGLRSKGSVWAEGVYGAGEEGAAPQPPQCHMGWAQGLQGLWSWHVPAGKAAVGEEEEQQLPVKHG